MTAVVSYGDLRVEFTGSTDFVLEAVSKVVYGTNTLDEVFAEGRAVGYKGVLHQASCDASLLGTGVDATSSILREPGFSSEPGLVSSGGGGGSNNTGGASNTGGDGLGQAQHGASSVNAKTLQNREKRQRRAAARKEKKKRALHEDSGNTAGTAVDAKTVTADSFAVPVWRRKAHGNGQACPSECGSAVSTASRTAVEIEAAQTLAARRVAENRVAILKAERTIRSFDDKEKTAALDTLEAAKVECRINVAMERSQKAYNNHDKSLKSVGSAASAGEFAFKKMVAKCAEQAELIASLTAQVDAALHASPGKVWEAVSAVPEARRVSVRDIMGEPDSKWSMKKTNTFYNILNAEAVGNYGSDWKDLF